MAAPFPAAVLARAARSSGRRSLQCHATRVVAATAAPPASGATCLGTASFSAPGFLHGIAQSRRHYAGCACSGAKPPTTAYIALGSNLGDRVAEIERACNEMDKRGIKVKRTSSLWETEPMYVTDQDRFLNGACEVRERRFLRSYGVLRVIPRFIENYT